MSSLASRCKRASKLKADKAYNHSKKMKRLELAAKLKKYKNYK